MVFSEVLPYKLIVHVVRTLHNLRSGDAGVLLELSATSQGPRENAHRLNDILEVGVEVAEENLVGERPLCSACAMELVDNGCATTSRKMSLASLILQTTLFFQWCDQF